MTPLVQPPCPYCGSPVEKRDSSCIYGRSFGLVAICTRYPACDAFVGCHKATGEPKGTLANSELREWRKLAHAAFDPLWLLPGDKRAHRQLAYAWLAQEIGLPASECHIGMMDEGQCRLVIEACARWWARVEAAP